MESILQSAGSKDFACGLLNNTVDSVSISLPEALQFSASTRSGVDFAAGL
jgi:hypothetical protein